MSDTDAALIFGLLLVAGAGVAGYLVGRSQARAPLPTTLTPAPTSEGRLSSFGPDRPLIPTVGNDITWERFLSQ